MYRLTNISPHSIALIKSISEIDMDYIFITIKCNECIDIDSLQDYVNLRNLIDPRLGLFKISLI